MVLDLADVSRGRTLRTVLKRELDAVTFTQGAETLGFNCRMMDEDILATIDLTRSRSPSDH